MVPSSSSRQGSGTLQGGRERRSLQEFDSVTFLIWSTLWSLIGYCVTRDSIKPYHNLAVFPSGRDRANGLIYYGIKRRRLNAS